MSNKEIGLIVNDNDDSGKYGIARLNEKLKMKCLCGKRPCVIGRDGNDRIGTIKGVDESLQLVGDHVNRKKFGRSCRKTGKFAYQRKNTSVHDLKWYYVFYLFYICTSLLL